MGERRGGLLARRAFAAAKLASSFMEQHQPFAASYPSLVHRRHPSSPGRAQGGTQRPGDGDMSILSRRGADAEGTCRMECPSLRRIITRLLTRMTTKKPASRGERESGNVAGNSKAGDLTAGSQCQEWKASPTAATITDTVGPGNNNKENVINLGVACSLFYLAVASKTVLVKMEGLRRDMEMLLREIKQELQGNNNLQEPSEVVGSPTSCLTDAGKMMLNYSSQGNPFVFVEEETFVGSSAKSKQDCVQEIKQLEAELEAELEHLQLHLDPGIPSKRGHQHAAKTRTVDSARETCGGVSFGEVMNPNDTGHSEFQGGVPPIELERKLHELLESRQEERIKELEIAVDCYKRKLCKKDKEISRWRDTAMLLSHHVKE